jgi:hypothetical protein
MEKLGGKAHVGQRAQRRRLGRVAGTRDRAPRVQSGRLAELLNSPEDRATGRWFVTRAFRIKRPDGSWRVGVLVKAVCAPLSLSLPGTIRVD